MKTFRTVPMILTALILIFLPACATSGLVGYGSSSVTGVSLGYDALCKDLPLKFGMEDLVRNPDEDDCVSADREIDNIPEFYYKKTGNARLMMTGLPAEVWKRNLEGKNP